VSALLVLMLPPLHPTIKRADAGMVTVPAPMNPALGDEFTPTLRAAWATAYSALSEMMIAAAYPALQRIRRNSYARSRSDGV